VDCDIATHCALCGWVAMLPLRQSLGCFLVATILILRKPLCFYQYFTSLTTFTCAVCKMTAKVSLCCTCSLLFVVVLLNLTLL